MEIDGEPVVFVDTAGWRRQARIDNQVEYFSIVRLWRTLDRADVALLVIDATEGVTDQDQKIAARIRDDGLASPHHRQLKWDLGPGEDERARELVWRTHLEDLHFMAYSPILRTSALTGSGLKKIMPEVQRAYANWQKRIQTSHLNQLKEEIILHPSALEEGPATADLLHHPGAHQAARVRLLRQRPGTGALRLHPLPGAAYPGDVRLHRLTRACDPQRQKETRLKPPVPTFHRLLHQASLL